MNELTTQKELTPQEVFERFLRLSVADGSASEKTLKAYRIGLSIFLNWCRDNQKDPLTATYDDLQEYRNFLQQRGSRGSARLHFVAVRVLYRALQRWGRRVDNPADGVKIHKDRTSASEKILAKALTRDEARQLWDYLCQESLNPPFRARLRAMIGLMLWAGLRVAEAQSLCIGDFNGTRGTELTVTGKGRRMRTIRLSYPVFTALTEWKRYTAGPTGWPLFASLEHPDKALSIREIQKQVAEVYKRLGLARKGRGCHSLRHTYAVLSVLGGAQREALGDSLGHSSLETTDIYSRAAARWQECPAEKVWEFVKGGTDK